MGIVKTLHISSTEQQADILTKALGRSQHEYLVSKMGVINVFTPTSEGEY